MLVFFASRKAFAAVLIMSAFNPFRYCGIRDGTTRRLSRWLALRKTVAQFPRVRCDVAVRVSLLRRVIVMSLADGMLSALKERYGMLCGFLVRDVGTRKIALEDIRGDPDRRRLFWPGRGLAKRNLVEATLAK